jgi:predicted nucleic acid-binding protein
MRLRGLLGRGVASVVNERLDIDSYGNDLTRSEARLYNEQWIADHTIHPLDTSTHELAMRWYLPKQLSLWDSLIIASANLANCTTLYSEDLNHGQTFGNAPIVHPFQKE